MINIEIKIHGDAVRVNITYKVAVSIRHSGKICACASWHTVSKSIQGICTSDFIYV